MFSDLQQLIDMGPLAVTAFFILAFWSLLFKGIALWISAREGKRWWFIVILILNTVGILEIVYIIFFSETGKKYIAGFKKHRAHKKATKTKRSKKETETEDSN